MASTESTPNNVPVIAGVVAGVGFCAICVGIAWWMLRRKRQRMTVQSHHRDLLIEDSHIANEKWGSNPLLPQHAFDDTPAAKEEYRKSQNKGRRFTNVVLSFASSKDSGPPSPLEPFPTAPHRPSLPPIAADVPAPPPTFRRTNSAKSLDSESLYSASSAPRSEAYEVTYQSWTLGTIPGSPNMNNTPMPPRRGPLHLVNSTQGGASVSTMREALAPETYTNHRLKESSTVARSKKRRSRSDVMAGTRLPPLPSTAPFKVTPPQLGRPQLPPITIPNSNSPSTSGTRPLPVPQLRN